MKNILITLFILCFSLISCSHMNSFDKTDKYLFTALTTAQITDGLTTIDGLKRGGKISEKWAWKYGSDRPSDTRIWVTKTAELGLAYVVANELPSKPRKAFLLGTTVLLFYYGINNGLQFSITY